MYVCVKQKHAERGVIWNNSFFFNFQQFTKSGKEKALLQPHRGKAFTRRTHRKGKDLSPSKTEHLFPAELIGQGRDLNQRPPYWCGCCSLRVCAIPCTFRGLRVWCTEVDKAALGWRVLKTWYFMSENISKSAKWCRFLFLVFWCICGLIFFCLADSRLVIALSNPPSVVVQLLGPNPQEFMWPNTCKWGYQPSSPLLCHYYITS